MSLLKCHKASDLSIFIDFFLSIVVEILFLSQQPVMSGSWGASINDVTLFFRGGEGERVYKLRNLQKFFEYRERGQKPQ